jgi:hypothetical protein
LAVSIANRDRSIPLKPAFLPLHHLWWIPQRGYNADHLNGVSEGNGLICAFSPDCFSILDYS